MNYTLPVFGYRDSTKTLLGHASYRYDEKESYVHLQKQGDNYFYRTATREHHLSVVEILHRAQCAIERIATQDCQRYEFRYIFDRNRHGKYPIACVALDTKTGWHGVSVVSNERESRTVVKNKIVKIIDKDTGEKKESRVSVFKTIQICDNFRYDVARERAIENIGRLRIPQRYLTEYDVTLKQIVNDIINDWELA